ncbi:MAG TPA: M20/M25/M40 family metallo-hydrolase [Candidatus Limnocylindrales bacterium]|nr:M20/M25/M40 family metallo-hydrolase [Candidatus Limnocylindrales bacterium]
MERENLPGIRRILFTVAVLAAILAISVVAIRPPAPRPATIPANQFSAARARDVLYQLVGDDLPHPIGSAQDDVVRGRILDQLTHLGYDPQVQTAFDCDEFGTCGTVRNVLARLEGTEPGPSVLLAAHYDSVPAGPGASDDGVGVAAVLEIARAMKSMPAPRHSVIFLIDEGEEAGLLGARAFVDSHPWAQDVRAAVNLDARGSSGPSLMFETGSANEWAVRLFAQHASHPATSSIFYDVYKSLPNDTDFTVFKSAGFQGLNFAFVGNEVHYHTPLDSFENASAASLQHQGDNALPSIVALANSDLQNLPDREAVYFDLFQHWVVRWPARWTLPVSFFVFVILGFQVVWLIRAGHLTVKQFLWGGIAWAVAILAAAVLGLILLRILRVVGAAPVNWIAHPLAIRVAMWSLALAVVISHGIFFGRRAAFWGFWAGTWAWMSLLSILFAWLLPGADYIVLIPCAVAALAALPFTLRRADEDAGQASAASLIPVILPLVVQGIVGFSLALMLYDTLGIGFLPAVAAVVAMFLAPLLPLCADLQHASGIPALSVPGVPLLLMIAAVFGAAVIPPFSAKAPQRVNLEFWQDADSGKAQWIVHPNSGRLPEPIRLATTFHRVDRGPFPWNTSSAFLADAPHLDFAPPSLTILESSTVGNVHNYRTLLYSSRGATQATIFFPPDSGIENARAEDIPLQPETKRVRNYFNDWFAYSCETMTPKGVEISFSLPVGRPVEVYVVDETFGLPNEGSFLLKSRPLTATPSQDGDITLVSRRVQFLP